LAQIASAPGLNVTELARALAIHQIDRQQSGRQTGAARLIRRERKRDDQRIVRLLPYPARQGHRGQGSQPVEGRAAGRVDAVAAGADLLKLDRPAEVAHAAHARARCQRPKHTPLADI
jgi:hypothetical protein